MRNLVRALIVALPLTALPVASQAGLFVGVSVNIAPPVLPVYVQPPCPAPGYIWVPGYWAWNDGYYWVPGTWVVAPAVGLLWTPGYWGWADGAYLWHAGYWGPHVGFYGGINYGFGYTGVGYQGGYWRGHEFYYNRAVTNIGNTRITNVYNRTVVNNVNVTHVSFNGGAGGVVARPNAAELSAEHERHLGLMPVQRQQQQLAERNPSLRASANGGRPAIAATPHAGVFAGHGVVAAHAPQPQHYAMASRPAPEHQARPEPEHQARPEPQHQARPEPRSQPQPAAHHQPAAAPQAVGRGGHEAGRPERGGSAEHRDEHNGHG
jgi:WXXGXW repeat (2 copies)